MAVHNRSEAIKILVVDDNAEIRNMIQTTLEGARYKVVTAANGKEGLREFRTGRFDLLIVDIFMPEQDGFEVLSQIRMTSQETKVLVISGGGVFDLWQALPWAERLGARHTLAKPFTPEDLLASVAKVLDDP